MTFQMVINILTLIVILAIITTIVARPNSASVINALGKFFSGSIGVAMGNVAGARAY